LNIRKRELSVKENRTRKSEVLRSPKFRWSQDSEDEHILPRCAISKRLRYEKQIKTLHLFRLLSLEMLHRRVEIEKQHFRKKAITGLTVSLRLNPDLCRLGEPVNVEFSKFCFFRDSSLWIPAHHLLPKLSDFLTLWV